MGLSGSVFTLWLETVDELAAGVMVVGFDHPLPQAAMKEPLVGALLFWLWLCSWGVVGSTGSDVLEEVIFTQCEGALSLKTSASVNVIRGSIASLSSLHTLPTGMAHLALAVGRFQPNAVTP